MADFLSLTIVNPTPGEHQVITDVVPNLDLPVATNKTFTGDYALKLSASKQAKYLFEAGKIEIFVDGLKLKSWPPTVFTNSKLVKTDSSVTQAYYNELLESQRQQQLLIAQTQVVVAPPAPAPLNGDVVGFPDNNRLIQTGVVPGIYLNADITVDAKGRILAAASNLAGGINAAQHEELRQLIHFISDGPAKGFLTGAYKETLPAASPFPTSIIWWEDATLTKKILEKTIVYVGVLPSTITWKIYLVDGVTVAEQAIDTIAYTGVFETSRTRAIS